LNTKTTKDTKTLCLRQRRDLTRLPCGLRALRDLRVGI